MCSINRQGPDNEVAGLNPPDYPTGGEEGNPVSPSGSYSSWTVYMALFSDLGFKEGKSRVGASGDIVTEAFIYHNANLRGVYGISGLFIQTEETRLD